MNIAIITSPFGLLPPKGIGAVEKIWYYLAEYFSRKNICIDFYSKEESANSHHSIIIHNINLPISKNLYLLIKLISKYNVKV